MTEVDSPASPLTPNSKAHLEVIAYNQYIQAKEQIHQLEQELTEFQESSKELELELEQELAESDKRQSKLEDRISTLESEVAEWRKKTLDAHKEAATTQEALQREVSSLRDAHKLVKERLRETENANDDIEQRERITCSTLEDIQTRYNEALENVAILEAELAAKDVLIGEHHRAKEEIKDLTEELEHTRKKLATKDQELEEANKRIMNPPPSAGNNKTIHRRAVSGTAQVSAEGYLTPLNSNGAKPMSSSRSMQFIHGLQSQMRSLESRVAHVKSSLPKPITPKRAKSTASAVSGTPTIRSSPSMALLTRKLSESDDLQVVSLSPSRSTSSLEDLCTPSPSPQIGRRDINRGDSRLDFRADSRLNGRPKIQPSRPSFNSALSTPKPLDPIEGSPTSLEARNRTRSASPAKKLSSLSLNTPSLPQSQARVNIPALMRPASPIKHPSPPKPAPGSKFADVYGRKR
ncbi:Nuclear distribution protein nudE-like protein 1 [Yarrowia sp. C11]|nr:Nuclear distribution protein nudE-like protein 1 [Yarrowia sp. C11]KAG5371152.1 Nuclear distribution protein nudE-like protein 1 [Yarrowia sp. E02]